MKISDDKITDYLDRNKEKLNHKNLEALNELLSLIPEENRDTISGVWQKSEKQETIIEEGGENE